MIQTKQTKSMRKRVSTYDTHMVYVNVMNEEQQIDFETAHTGTHSMTLSRGKWAAVEREIVENGVKKWTLKLDRFR